MAITRRKFLATTAVAGASLMMPWKFGAREAIAANSSPLLQKWVGPLRGLMLSNKTVPYNNPPAAAVKWLMDPKGIPVLDFPMMNVDPTFDAKSLPYVLADLTAAKKETLVGASMYKIDAGEFTDFLHPAWEPTAANPAGFPTKLWGYCDATNPVKRHLAGVIVAVRGFGNRLRFTNKLTANGLPTGAALQHLVPNDKLTIPGANEGDNRLAVHLHGGWMPWIHDGGPFDWWRPDGTKGASFMNGPGGIMDNVAGQPINAGQADYYYPNLASSRLIWYHDHAFGITRINAYAGLATGYLTLDPLQEVVLNKTLEHVAKYTNLLDQVFKRYLGVPVDGVDLNDVTAPTRTTVVNAVTNPNPTIPSILSTIPVVIQEKKFVDAVTTPVTDPTWATVARPDVQTTGSIWYEHVYNPQEFKLLKGRAYTTPPNPSAIPEFVGDTTLVNGTIAPFAEVEPKPYRFLFLNATQARGYNLNLRQVPTGAEVATDPRTGLPVVGTVVAGTLTTGSLPGPTMWIIGTEGGYLNKAVACNNNTPLNLLTFTGNMVFLGGERLDVVVDFSGFADGTEFVFYNDAVAPFPAGPPTNDYYTGNNNNPAMKGVPAGTTRDTRNILKIKVKGPVSVPEPTPNANMIPATLPRVWDAFEVSYAGYGPILNNPLLAGRYTPLTAPAVSQVRNLTLNETFDKWGRLQQLIGGTTFNAATNGFGLEYLNAVTETVTIGYDGTKPVNQQSTPTLEIWNIYNTTADTHPMHFHMSNVQILSRQPFTLTKGILTPTPGLQRGPEPFECGWKEVCQCHPGEVISVLIKWELPPVPFGPIPPSARIGGYETVWHCHILEHEEHDMMRPIQITSTNPWW